MINVGCRDIYVSAIVRAEVETSHRTHKLPALMPNRKSVMQDGHFRGERTGNKQQKTKTAETQRKRPEASRG